MHMMDKSFNVLSQQRTTCDVMLQVRGRQSYEILCALRDCLELSSLLPPQLSSEYRAKQVELHRRQVVVHWINAPLYSFS